MPTQKISAEMNRLVHLNCLIPLFLVVSNNNDIIISIPL